MNAHRALDAIREAKALYGKRLVILAHHYQADDVAAQADFVGDSLELARRAAQAPQAEYIVFCGVYFMAETAAILAPDKVVVIPDASAGCPLADSATADQVRDAWDAITSVDPSVTPVTYVNSSARLKAFCGERSGAVCTSANADKVVSWALGRSSMVLFMPDMNLGMNTARELGIEPGRIRLWDPAAAGGGLERKDIMSASMVLWKGCCPVHYPTFTAEDVNALKKARPGIRVIVHPETGPDTVEAAGEAGSTSRMLAILEGMQGGAVALGTEANMVKRAAGRHAGRLEVVSLREVYCGDMAKITIVKLAEALAGLKTGGGRVRVPGPVAENAAKALQVMLGM